MSVYLAELLTIPFYVVSVKAFGEFADLPHIFDSYEIDSITYNPIFDMGSQQWNIPHVAQLKDVEIVIQSRHDFVILQMCVVYVNIPAVYPFENSRDAFRIGVWSIIQVKRPCQGFSPFIARR